MAGAIVVMKIAHTKQRRPEPSINRKQVGKAIANTNLIRGSLPGIELGVLLKARCFLGGRINSSRLRWLGIDVDSGIQQPRHRLILLSSQVAHRICLSIQHTLSARKLVVAWSIYNAIPAFPSSHRPNDLPQPRLKTLRPSLRSSLEAV